MSEQKRASSDFRFGHATQQPAAADIENSQPRPTVELPRANALLNSSAQRGGDPYNSVGAHMHRTNAA